MQKGWDQDLCISSATSNQNLWALVMDEATGYSQQAYTVSREFLPRSWCMAQWTAGYYITAVAGPQAALAPTCSLLAEAWTPQHMDAAFAAGMKAIENCRLCADLSLSILESGFMGWAAALTISLVRAGADNGRCLAVVSKGTRWQQQSYKVDDKFPYDWVKRKWAEKFAITSIATTLKGGEPVSRRIFMPNPKAGLTVD